MLNNKQNRTSKVILLFFQLNALCDIVAHDTKARHACGFPAPSYNQMKSLQDVRQYTDAEQVLIMRRLLMPYNCGVRSGQATVASKPIVTETKTSFPAKPVATTKAVVTESGPKSVQAAASTKNQPRYRIQICFFHCHLRWGHYRAVCYTMRKWLNNILGLFLWASRLYSAKLSHFPSFQLVLYFRQDCVNPVNLMETQCCYWLKACACSLLACTVQACRFSPKFYSFCFSIVT